MSLLALAIPKPGGDAPADVRAMLAESVGGALREDVAGPIGTAGVTLGVRALPWERAANARVSEGLVRRGPWTAAADATLVFRDDLLRALRAKGVAPTGGTDGDLILAAYEAFGDDAPLHLEGDFAFVVVDARTAGVFAARDPMGRRALHIAEHEGAVHLATRVSQLLRVPGIPRDLDLAVVATAASGMWGHGAATAYRAIRALRPGHSLAIDGARAVRTTRWWTPPMEIVVDHRPRGAAAAELRGLLTDAVRERLASEGPTAISLSGGWDSPSVYGAARAALGGAPGPDRRLRAISVSYPEGDPGREDELIDAILARWEDRTEWIDVDTIPVFAEAEARAAARTAPFGHAYEEWNRALQRRAAALGARVLFDGAGGDQLFQVSAIALSDLARGGRWMELARQYRTRPAMSAKAFYRLAIRPALPRWAVRAISWMRRTELPAHYLDRRPGPWFRHDFLARHDVFERERLERPALPAHSAIVAETHAYLRFDYFARVLSSLRDHGMEEGVETRSPLLDARVIDFAARRPLLERADGPETKILLREAMRGLLPDPVLAPRARRTGITTAYFFRQLRGPGREHVERMLADSRLAALGMIDPRRLRHAWEYVLQHDDDETAARIYLTLQADLWLRTRPD